MVMEGGVEKEGKGRGEVQDGWPHYRVNYDEVLTFYRRESWKKCADLRWL